MQRLAASGNSPRLSARAFVAVPAFVLFLAVAPHGILAAATDPFKIDPNKVTSINGTVDPSGAVKDANSVLQKKNLNSYSSIQNLAPANVQTNGLAKDLGVTQTQLNDAMNGQTASWQTPQAQFKKDMIGTVNQAGYKKATFSILTKASWTENITVPGGTTAPTMVKSAIIARTGRETANQPEAKISAWLASMSATNIDNLIATKITVTRASLGATAGNALLATYPCAIDTKIGTDTCCGLATANVKFYLRNQPGIGDNLDKAGANDALLLDKSAVPVSKQPPLDVLTRLMLCTSVSAMDNVVAGTGMVAGEGVIN